MIPGTAKEIAALANARASLLFCKQSLAYGGTRRTWQTVKNAERNLKLAERRELVAAEKLPGSSALPHRVALAVDLVSLSSEPIEVSGFYGLDYWLRFDVEKSVFDTSMGSWKLWFDQDGNAFVSFEHDEDATLFRLALDA